VSRRLGYVVFRLFRDADGSVERRHGEILTTHRDYLKGDGKFWWNPNEARRFPPTTEGSLLAQSTAHTLSAGEGAYVAALFPSRDSERAAALLEAKLRRIEKF